MYICVEEISPDKLERKIWDYMVRTPMGVYGNMELVLISVAHVKRKSSRHRTWDMISRWDRHRTTDKPCPDVPKHIKDKALAQLASRVEFSEK